MVDEGADLIDVGGESTRPGADAAGRGRGTPRACCRSSKDWPRRVRVPLSIDTYKASTAAAALAAGAVDGQRRQRTAVRAGAGGRRGQTSRAHRPDAHPRPVEADVRAGVVSRRGRRSARRVAREHGVCDQARVSRPIASSSIPGLGFAKDAAHSYEALARLDEFAELGRPLLVGPSRKSFLAKPLGNPGAGRGSRLGDGRRRSGRGPGRARTSSVFTRCARCCRSSGWPTRFGAIIRELTWPG